VKGSRRSLTHAVEGLSRSRRLTFLCNAASFMRMPLELNSEDFRPVSGDLPAQRRQGATLSRDGCVSSYLISYLIAPGE
jgi:hypothetical protein